MEWLSLKKSISGCYASPYKLSPPPTFSSSRPHTPFHIDSHVKTFRSENTVVRPIEVEWTRGEMKSRQRRGSFVRIYHHKPADFFPWPPHNKAFNFCVLIKFFCRSKLPRGPRLRSTAARLLRSWVRIPPGAWMFVVCVVCCDELITRPEESYRLWQVVVCDQEPS
jgi:hypothetical protein